MSVSVAKDHKNTLRMDIIKSEANETVLSKIMHSGPVVPVRPAHYTAYSLIYPSLDNLFHVDGEPSVVLVSRAL